MFFFFGQVALWEMLALVLKLTLDSKRYVSVSVVYFLINEFIFPQKSHKTV